MTVKDIVRTCTSMIWITFDEDPENYEIIDFKFDNSFAVEKYIKEKLLNHEVYLISALDDILVVSLNDLEMRG